MVVPFLIGPRADCAPLWASASSIPSARSRQSSRTS